METSLTKKQRLPRILKKFYKLQRRNKPLYQKAFGFMRAITDVLSQTIKDLSATAYYASIEQYLLNDKQSSKTEPEVVAYCYSAVISMLDISVIQQQSSQIEQIIRTKLLVEGQETSQSPYVGKYGVIVLQFLLHSKTEQQWKQNDKSTVQMFNKLLNCLVDKRQKVQKQAIKSTCILLRNKHIQKIPNMTRLLKEFVTSVFNQQIEEKTSTSNRTLLIFNFLSAGLQVMPISLCCEMSNKIVALATCSEDASIKTHAYLTLEVLYASRRFKQSGDHLEHTLRQLLDGSEVLTQAADGIADGQENRVISYMQATSQVLVNMASQDQILEDEFLLGQTLKLITATFSVFCEYLVNTNRRIKQAAFSTMRLIIVHGLKRQFFMVLKNQKKSSKDDITQILNLDALTISEEVNQMRKGGKASMSPQDKFIIHMCYLLTSRFEEAYDVVFKLVKTFIESVGSALSGQTLPDLLLVISEIKVRKYVYDSWTTCIGAFLGALGCDKFFKTLPLRLTEFDMNSLTYAQDSRSFLLQVVSSNLKPGRADIAFFVEYFMPLIKHLDKIQKQETKQMNQVKAKKLETLQQQIWQLLPCFCRTNSSRLSEAFSTLIPYLEHMVNKNDLHLRSLALQSFSALIDHCRTTRVVTEEIKKTRTGLQRICMDYIQGLSKLFCNSTNQTMTDQEKTQTLTTLKDFASIAKSVKLSNLFLQSFAELVSQLEQNQGPVSEEILQSLDVLLAIMEKVKLKKENYNAIMRGIKGFIDNSATQKRGYKILVKVIEKYELENIDELFTIQKELTPLMKGQTTKQRLQLIQSYVKQLLNFKDDAQNLAKVSELVKTIIIELITAINNSNFKIRKLTKEIFESMSELFQAFNSASQLLQLLLIGFAGTSHHTQACTIRALIFNLKINVVTDNIPLSALGIESAEGRLRAEDTQVQNFLKKVSKIVILFLKDASAPKEIHKSVLKFIRIICTYLTSESLREDLCQLILNTMFSLKNKLKKTNKYMIYQRKVVSKLIYKLGLDYLQKIVTNENKRLLAYIERENRKKRNKKERLRLLAILGGHKSIEELREKAKKDSLAEIDSDDDDSDDEEPTTKQSGKGQDVDMESDGDDDDDDSDYDDEDDDDEDAHDNLQVSNGMDIPYAADDIPVISTLANDNTTGDEKVDRKNKKSDENTKKVNEIIEVDNDNLETHFVENPFIKMREKVSKRTMAGKRNLDGQDLEQAADGQAQDDLQTDILRIKESGKFVVKDLEMLKTKKQEIRELKRRRGEVSDEDTSDDEDLKTNNQVLKQRIRDVRHGGNKATKTQPSKMDISQQQSSGFIKKRDAKKMQQPHGGHHTKFSGDEYRSKKGSGDMLKAGKHEPFAYIQLNPEMLNPRKKNQAVKSFTGIVSHGKKLNKRSGSTGKKNEGLLQGMGYKKKE